MTAADAMGATFVMQSFAPLNLVLVNNGYTVPPNVTQL